MESVAEVWRKIPGHDLYEVSSCGRVRSLTRTSEFMRNGRLVRRTYEGRMLKHIDNHGYAMVKLGHPDLQIRVHQAVALAFIGPVPDGMVINHINGNKRDNRPENLEYCTNSENVKHAYRTGLLTNNGSANGKSKLTERMVIQILKHPNSIPAWQVAESVGCGTHSVQQIRSGRAWTHVSRDYVRQP